MKLNDYKQLEVFKTLMILIIISLLLIISIGYSFSQVNITTVDSLELTTTYSDVACYGKPSIIESTVLGGKKPYIYTYFKLNGYNNDTIYNGYNNKIEVYDGYYRVRVTDANGKTVETKVDGNKWSWLKIYDNTLPLEPIYDITYPSRNGSNNGKIVITDVKNGFPPFSYDWGNFSYENTIKRLSVGTYYVEVTDAIGCQIKDTIVLTKYKRSTTLVNKSLLENDSLSIDSQNIQLGQSYPNPIINPSRIEYLIPRDSKGVLDIMDVNGKILYSFTLDPNNYYIDIYRNNFDYGRYFYSLYIDGKFYDTKQFVVF